MRLRFTIRELLLLTAIAALAVGWCVDSIRHEQMARQNATYRTNLEQVQREANNANHKIKGLELIIDRLDRQQNAANQAAIAAQR